jgi:putative nucleotidyltransferase with HDIG domain
VPRFQSSAERYLPHALLATFAVIVLPALAVSFVDTSGRPWLLLSTVLLALLLSVAVASVGSALWAKQPHSSDLVFGDLMIWGWVRRVRAERRVAEARRLLGADSAAARGASRERRCAVIQRLAAMLEAKDPDTLGHSRRVARHAERIAREMGLSREDVANVRIAASVHDVGKVNTPREILTKPDSLTPAEFEVMKRHPVDGAQLVGELGNLDITAMVRHHHERMDGSGYPDGLRGDEIPVGARIISVADTFDAITSNRTYHSARRHRRALDVVSAEAGATLDPDAAAAFLMYYSGKRGVAWSALGVTGPPRIVASASALFNGVGGWTSPVAQGLAAIVAAVLAGGPLERQPASATAASDRALAAAGSELARDPRGGSGPASRGRTDGVPGIRRAPVGERPGDRRLREAPAGGSPGPGSPPEGTGRVPSAEPMPIVDRPRPEQPPVELPPVELPPVELPDLEVPQLAVPDVELQPIELPAPDVPISPPPLSAEDLNLLPKLHEDAPN